MKNPLIRFGSRILRLGAIAALIAGILAWTGAASAQRTAGEHEVKAAFLFNFARFTEWPTESDALVLCVQGRDGVADLLDALEGRSVQGRRVQLLHKTESTDLQGCHMLYVALSETGRLAEITTAARHTRSVLTVSDIGGFAAAGGMIELVSEAQRIQFDVNLAAVEESGVRISSKLLRLARRIEVESQ